MNRKYTTRLLELVNAGDVDKDFLIQNLLMFMSEAEVKEFFTCTICDPENRVAA